MGYPQKGRCVCLLDPSGTPTKQGDVGTIAIHREDAGLMLEYLNAPNETAARFQGDWFVTGDLGRADPSGAIHYEGRDDDMMNAGGFRVSPIEIEGVFQNAQGIIQCAAIELALAPDTKVIALCYTAQAPLKESTLQALASRHLARYKQPRIYHHSDTLPTSANGKLLRRVLRSQIEAHYGQS